MKKVILALAVCAAFASCQKNDDTKIIDVSKTTYLMDGHWQMKIYTYQPDITDTISAPSNAYTPLASCEKDNYFNFYSKTGVSLNEGNSKCQVTAPDSLAFGYSLSNNDKHIRIITNPGDSIPNVYLEGEMKYPSIDTFVLTYTQRNQQDSALTARFVRTYIKIK